MNAELHSMEQMKDGNNEAYKSLFDNYYTCLLLYANSIINNIDISKDILQDVFLKLWERRRDLKVESSVKSYLYAAVRNSCLDYLKHLQVEKKYMDYSFAALKEKELDYFIELFPSPDEGNPEKYLEEIAAAIENLPEQCRKIFKLSRYEGMKNSAVSRQLNLSTRTVDTQIYRALKTIRQKLNKYFTCT
jgi:RNA polymerase sigma-70 factor (ECF subfamily)